MLVIVAFANLITFCAGATITDGSSLGLHDPSSSQWTVAPRTATVRANIGERFFNEGKYDQALVSFQAAVMQNPVHAGLWAQLGMTQFKLGQLDDAKEAFSRASAIDPKDTGTVMLSDMQQGKEVEPMIESSQKISSRNSLAKKGAFDLMDEAIKVAESGAIDEALELFKQVVKADPTNGRFHENLGVTYLRLQLLPEARASFERARKLLPKNDHSIKRNLNAIEEAESTMGVEVLDNYVGSGDDEDYYDYTDETTSRIEVDEEDIDRITNQAIRLAERGDIVDALPLFQKAVDMDATKSTSLINLAVKFSLASCFEAVSYMRTPVAPDTVGNLPWLLL